MSFKKIRDPGLLVLALGLFCAPARADSTIEVSGA
jgi:hypothetical protein